MSGGLLIVPGVIVHKRDATSRYWQRLNDRTAVHALTPVKLHCRCCSRMHTIALPDDAKLRELLADLACPSCRVQGTMTVVRDEPEVA